MKTLLFFAIVSFLKFGDPVTLEINQNITKKKCSNMGYISLGIDLRNNSNENILVNGGINGPGFTPFPLEFIASQKEYFNTFFLLFDENSNQIHNSTFPVPTKNKCKIVKQIGLAVEVEKTSNFKKNINLCLRDLNLTKGKKYSIVLAISQQKDSLVVGGFRGFIKSNTVNFTY